MSKFIDLSGVRFGRLTAVMRDRKTDSSGNSYWKCICDCGNEIVASGCNLKKNHTQSCGCYMMECLSNRKTHGMTKTRLYHIWQNMKVRCYKPRVTSYVNYGGRGITVCEEWLARKQGSQNFINWAMSNGYSDDLTIDRIDVNGNYSPDNCRWATMTTQAQNTRTQQSRCNGVSWNGECNKWRARIHSEGKLINIGSFENIEDAINARKNAEKLYWGKH